MTITENKLSVRPLTSVIGAEVHGVRLAEPLSDETIAEIRGALIRHKVLFFPGQNDLDSQGQVNFARRFGAVTTETPYKLDNRPKEHSRVQRLDSRVGVRSDHWHTDGTWCDHPPLATMLRAVELPSLGGDTCFANTANAYELLSPEIRALVEQLWVIHTNVKDWTQRREERSIYIEPDEFLRDENLFITRQPLVRVHPETNERTLMVGDFARRIPALTPRESMHLLEMLQETIVEISNTVRWRWTVGDVAFWDNRATQHYAVSDYGTETRVMDRLTLAGPVPVSVDGQSATMLHGDVTEWLKDTGEDVRLA